mmetsp:Transcript_16143/g.34897  ORF Transcript_16143/g.34897 Transcript_16143/m.34897 type:complete len:674 (+) Transcript_16143:208-2229(+)|eukprot:CAMPEP_0172302076 /NCGR_PEP_ID=MMETSP1058-20130122/3830_1 /TAXON_ID=83371 /ORGANISM="Detonula confervacea, Strain CCMP 353" /LENGTH=673 /DNA_ID=CAMNT_0013012425 /DNA_START=196 /DNA_END=2217 /DNA_ORIENTATION=-
MIYDVLVIVAAISTLILTPNNVSHALSPANFGSGPQCSHPALSSGVSHRQSHSLRAVAENTLTAETYPEADETDIPTSNNVAPTMLTVVAGSGARITSVSGGVAVEQDFWENNFDQDDPSKSFVDTFPTPDNTKVGVSSGQEENVVVDYEPFPGELFYGEGIHVNDIPIVTEIKNGSENSKETDSISDELDDSETQSAEDSSSERDSTNNDESEDSAIRSTMAKAALLRRAGIAGTGIKSSRSNGRSSRAKTHVNKSRRGSVRNQGAGAMGRVLSTVRTAAAAAAEQKKSLGKSEGNTSSGETINNALMAKPPSLKWKNAIHSAVVDMMKNQDAFIQQQSVDVTPYMESTNSPPPGTSSMGLLGEVVQDKLPAIPPLPGKFLVRTNGDLRDNKPQIIIRSSIPHSSDDTHIADLRLSVFSRFDEEQQRNFRSRSVEVLNVRRRRGAVVIVAELPKEEGSLKEDEERPYLNEMQARVAKGHKYGEINGRQSASVASNMPSSPSLIVTTIRGARITSVTSGIVATGSDRGSLIGSVECSHQEFRGTMLGNSRPKGSLLYVTEVAVRTDARRCGAGAMLMRGVDKIAAIRNVETIYLHVDMTNRAACAMYEKCGYRYLDKRDPIYAQFTASLNLHDGAMHGRKHYFLCKNRTGRTTWFEDDDLFSEMRKGSLGMLG